jgi:acyl-CoA synthetase (AMP-forming)/AMP-acid ligase II
MSMRIDDLLQAAVRETPDKLALKDFDDRQWSWVNLQAAAEAARTTLEHHGVRPGDRVVIVLENAAVMVAYLFGCSMMNAIAVPVNARLTRAELDRIVTHSDAGAVVMTVETGRAPKAHAEALAADLVDGPMGAVAIAPRAGAQGEPVYEDGARQVAVMLYTSGTTGAPKGAMLSHATMLAAAAASQEFRGIVPGDVTYLALPMSHIFGLVTILAVSRARACARLEARFDVARLYQALQEDVTLLPAVPQMHAHLFHHARDLGEARYTRGLLRFASSGGAPLDPAWKREAEAFYGIALQNGYGLTETAAGVCATRSAIGDPDVSVGVPMQGSELRINLEAPGAHPDEGIGEIEIGGPQLMLGYFRDPEQTRAVMTPDGWFRSGDLGRFDDAGRLHIVGRTKELIIHSGFNVYPAEVEAALTEHGDVIMAAVVGRKIEGNEEVLAFVTCCAGAGMSEARLIAFLRERLAAYKVPARIVIADVLPAAPTGKILKSGLLTHFAEELG